MSAADAHPTVRQLFTSFLTLGLTGFGGVLPLARHMIVEQKGWLDNEEFIDLLGLCQFLPGGNIINIATAIGLKFRGPLGAIAALFGLIAAPAMIAILLGVIYDRFENEPHVRHVFIGLAAAAAGLLVAMAVKVAMQLRGKPAAILIAAVCFAAIAWFRLPLIPTMLVLLPISMLAARGSAR